MEHIVILKKNILDKILSGEKTIETRFTKNKCVPFKKVAEGDTLFLKAVGGEILAKAVVKKVENYVLNEQKLRQIVNLYHKEIGVESSKVEQFVLKRKDKNYAVLVWLSELKNISPFSVKKSYGAGWICCSSIEEYKL